ncbi:zinc transporter ZIP1-like protein [Leptotrombidium deliense]|uniref:Zinc transporter ZIP1-like protein n=1 Tax=Leptotrombidium deliense TaxID=299467 RepID=A0A443S8T1_9ACAR|nr:zinc transporter ZIP1-like protein [Leptotrombidium deliense]
MSLLATRLAALFTLFLMTALVGCLPVFIFRYWTKRKNSSCLDISGHKQRNSKSATSAIVLQLLMFFGGGVLLATCFVHLIPEVRENFDEYFKTLNRSKNVHDHDHDQEEPHSHEHEENESDHVHSSENHSHNKGHTHSHGVPYVELAICGGFFIIYFLEELIHAIIGHDHHSDNGSQGSSFEIENECNAIDESRDEKYNFRADANLKNSPAFLISCHTRSDPVVDTKKTAYDNLAIDLRGDTCQPVFFTQNSKNHSSSQITITQSIETMSSTGSTKLPALVRFLQGLVTVGAFSAHSVFDGVAIGLQTTNTQIWTMLFAISVHKLVVAFVVGMELFEQTSSVIITTIHMILFSLTSPIGILLVILTESSVSEQKSPVLIILSAVATGTILYIIFFEILRRDKYKKLAGLVQFAAMIVGFAVMLCINLFIAH